MKKLYLLVCTLSLALAACSGERTGSPTNPSPANLNSTSTDPTPGQPIDEVDACAFNMTVLDASNNQDNKFGYLKVRNDGQCDRIAGVAIYKPISNSLPMTLDNQELVSNDFKVVKPGETVELFAYLPPCDNYQYDPYHSMVAGKTPNFGNGENLFDISAFTSHYGSTGECAAPPAPPAPPMPPVPPTIPPTTPRPVCPVVTPQNFRKFVTKTNVVADSPTTAVSSFTVNVPAGCTVPLSVVSYRIRKCGEKFPQAFIDGSTKDGSAKLYGPGTYVNQMRVTKTAVEYQVDLRVEGFKPGEDLTEQNEKSYYKIRTLDWIVDRVCLPQTADTVVWGTD